MSPLSQIALLFQDRSHSFISADNAPREGFPGQMRAPSATKVVESAHSFSNPEGQNWVNLEIWEIYCEKESSNGLQSDYLKTSTNLKYETPPSIFFSLQKYFHIKACFWPTKISCRLVSFVNICKDAKTWFFILVIIWLRVGQKLVKDNYAGFHQMHRNSFKIKCRCLR